MESIALDRFDDAARRVLAAANQEACLLGFEYVGTELVLLALAEDADRRAADELRRLGAEPRRLRPDTEKLWRVTLVPLTNATLPLTPRVKRAPREAGRLATGFVGPIELLHGLLNDPDSTATQLVLNAGGNLKR